MSRMEPQRLVLLFQATEMFYLSSGTPPELCRLIIYLLTVTFLTLFGSLFFRLVHGVFACMGGLVIDE